MLYAAMLPSDNGTSRDVWVDGPEPFVLVDGEPCYDFDPADYKPEEIITPRSRTFIPARVTDNPHLYGTGYMAQLQALPEPLRSQMLNGDFHAGMEDDPWQVIPTAWIERDEPLARAQHQARDGQHGRRCRPRRQGPDDHREAARQLVRQDAGLPRHADARRAERRGLVIRRCAIRCPSTST
jgi:hypothetical protein